MNQPRTLIDSAAVCSGDALVAGLFPGLGVFALTAGSGGGAGGPTLARTAVDALHDYFERRDGCQDHRASSPFRALVTIAGDPGTSVLAEGLRVAHQRVGAVARSPDGRPWGFSSVCAIHVHESIFVAHAGDVRAYVVTGGLVTRLTRDHTFREAPEASFPGASREVIAGIRETMGHVVTRALGLGDLRTHALMELEVDVKVLPRLAGDVYVLCDAGLHGSVAEEEIGAAITAAKDLNTAAEELVALATDRKQPHAGCVLVRLLA